MVDDLQRQTAVVKMQRQEAFHAERRKGIGGSDVAILMRLRIPGIKVFGDKTPLDIYLEKRGESEPSAPARYMEVGTHNESMLRRWMAEDVGERVLEEPRMLVHPEHSWMIAHVDGLLTVVGIEAVAELKIVGPWADRSEWGETGTDMVPLQYLFQCQHYLGVTGRDLCYLGAWFGGDDFRIYHIHRDDGLIGHIIDVCGTFWSDHVETGVPPEPLTNADAKIVWGVNDGTMREADEEAARILRELSGAKEAAKNAKELVAALELDLKRKIQDADGLQNYEGQTLVTWKTQATRRLDTKALREEAPEVAKRFEKTTQSRVLRLTKYAKEA